MSSTKGKREPADSLPRLNLSFWPYRTGTVAEISVGYRDRSGPHVTRIAYWHLDLARADVQGRHTDDVLRLLVDSLVRHLDGPGDAADYRAPLTQPSEAEGSGAPLGATGGTVTQDCLPGFQLPLDTPGGIALV